MSLIAITLSSYTAFFYSFADFYEDARIVTSIVNAGLLSAISIGFLNQDNPFILNEYITGFFLYDLIVGHYLDRKNTLSTLSGYAHHIIYIGLLTYLRYTNESRLIYLFLPFEIPTVILDIKKLYPSELLNIIFGIQFLVFRIFYNLYVIYVIPIQIYKIVPTATLILHIYWFNLWSKRYLAIA